MCYIFIELAIFLFGLQVHATVGPGHEGRGEGGGGLVG